MERKLNDYVKKLEEVSNNFPDIVGKEISIYAADGSLMETRVITGVFKDPDFKEGVYVFLLGNGKHIVKTYDSLIKNLKGGDSK